MAIKSNWDQLNDEPMRIRGNIYLKATRTFVSFNIVSHLSYQWKNKWIEEFTEKNGRDSLKMSNISYENL